MVAFPYWHSEIARTEAGGEAVDPQRHERSGDDILGYWRIIAAKMKTDWPVLIHRRDDAEGYTVQFGGGRPRPFNEGEEQAFRDGTFLKCKAVRRSDWTLAVQRGEWPDDQKRAIPQSPEEKYDIIPTTPESEGGNQITDDRTGEVVDAFWAQIRDKLASQITKAGALGTLFKQKRAGKDYPIIKITTQAQAEQAAAIRDAIRELGGMGEKKRKEEKKPFDDGAAAVQAKWVPVLEPASETALGLLNGIDEFQAAEKARLEKIERDRIAEETRQRLAKEAEDRKIEADRIAEETRQRLAKEAADRAAEAEQQGAPAPAAPTEEEIEAQIAAEAPPVPTSAEIEAQALQTAAEAPVEVTKPQVQGGAYSRAASKSRIAVGTITDLAALAKHFVDAKDADFIDYMQKRANAAARAKITLPGMRIE